MLEKIGIVAVIFVCLFSVAHSQENMDVARAFGEQFNFHFLENIEQEIVNAGFNKNAVALAGYASLLLYAEKVSGKKIPEITGVEILEEATKIAITKHDSVLLNKLANIWEDEIFGAGNKKVAQHLRQGDFSIRVQPSYKEVIAGETVVLQVVRNVNLVTTSEVEIPLDQLQFSVDFGKFVRNEYIVPKNPRNVLITITHIPTNRFVYAFLFPKK